MWTRYRARERLPIALPIAEERSRGWSRDSVAFNWMRSPLRGIATCTRFRSGLAFVRKLYKVSTPWPSNPCFVGKSKGNPEKRKGFSLRGTPKFLRKERKTPQKSKENQKTEKARKSKKSKDWRVRAGKTWALWSGPPFHGSWSYKEIYTQNAKCSPWVRAEARQWIFLTFCQELVWQIWRSFWDAVFLLTVGSFLLTCLQWSFCTYNWQFWLFYSQLEFFCLQL